MELFAVKVPSNVSIISEFSFLLKYLNKEKRRRINQTLISEEAFRSLIADICIRTLACQRTNLKNEDLIFSTQEYGKPFLVTPSNLHYNISHSGEWVLVVIAECEVGIDVEQQRQIDYLKFSKRLFTHEEFNTMLATEKRNQLDYFYYLWTLKESFVKTIGTGLNTPLNSFGIRKYLEKDIVISENKHNKAFHLMKYTIDSSYTIGVCAQCSEPIFFPTKITKYSYDNLITQFLKYC